MSEGAQVDALKGGVTPGAPAVTLQNVSKKPGSNGKNPTANKAVMVPTLNHTEGGMGGGGTGGVRNTVTKDEVLSPSMTK